MVHPDPNACVNAAHNNALKISIVWCLSVMRTRIYVLGIKPCSNVRGLMNLQLNAVNMRQLATVWLLSRVKMCTKRLRLFLSVYWLGWSALIVWILMDFL
jgi:hypothetical protein